MSGVQGARAYPDSVMGRRGIRRRNIRGPVAWVAAVVMVTSLMGGLGLATANAAGDPATDVLNAVNAKRKSAGMHELLPLACTQTYAANTIRSWTDGQIQVTDQTEIAAACKEVNPNQIVGNIAPAAASGQAIVDAWMADATSREQLMGPYTNAGVACEIRSGLNFCEAIFTNPARLDPLTITVFGDSYTAGNGVGDGAKGWRGLTETNSYQSPNNQTHVLAKLLMSWTNGLAPSVDDYSHSGSVTASVPEMDLVFEGTPPANADELRKADAKARDVEGTRSLKTEIDKAESEHPNGFQPGIVVVGIGGNDIAFAKIAEDVLVLPSNKDDAVHSLEMAEGLLEPAMVRAEIQFQRLVKDAAPNSVLLIQGYPYLSMPEGAPIVKQCENALGKKISDSSCAPTGPQEKQGEMKEYQYGPRLMALQNLADQRYQAMANSLQEFAKPYGVIVKYVPYAEATKGQAPYLTNRKGNPARTITTAFEVGDSHLPNGDPHEWIHPTALMRVQEGQLLLQSLLATPELNDTLFGGDIEGVARQQAPILDATVPVLPTAQAGFSYGYLFTAQGSPAPVWEVSEGPLPSGLELGPTGMLYGTPDRPGTYPFKIRVTSPVDGGAQPSEARFTLTVAPPPPDSAPSLKPANTTTKGFVATATLDQDYQFQLPFTGYPAPQFFITDGELPEGMFIYPDTGEILGRPTTAGDYQFTVTASNTVDGYAETTSATYMIRSAPATPVQLTIPTGALDGATTGVPYELRLTVDASPDPSFEVSDGTLPAGLTLDPVTGVISGTPTTPGEFSFRVKAANQIEADKYTSEVAYTITVAESAPPVITTDAGALRKATVGAPYFTKIEATGYPAPTFAVGDDPLPEGLELNAETGVISGTPTTSGDYAFRIIASNEVNGARSSDYRDYTMQIQAPPVPARLLPLVGGLPAGTVGEAYSKAIPAEGNPAPTYAVVGALPDGLALDSATGVISGTPTTAGEVSFQISVTNEIEGETATDTQDYTIVVRAAEVAADLVTPAGALPDGTAGVAYSKTLEAVGNPAPVLAFEDGSLPDGLEFDPATGVIAGTPTQAGDWEFSISATNTVGGEPAGRSVTYSIHIAAAPVPAQLMPLLGGLPVATVGTAYSAAIPATGNPAPTFAPVGSLPDGLSLNPVTGAITGTPTTAGEVTFTVTVSNTIDDELKTDSADYTILVVAAPEPAALVTAVDGLPNATYGEPYSFRIEATGNPAPVFSITGEELPAGLSLDAATGVISGVPATAGQWMFEVTATNDLADGPHEASRYYFMWIEPGGTPVEITTPAGALADATAGTAYEAQITATGDPVPTFSILGGSLPDGLDIDEVTGVIAGTPTTPGDYQFTVEALQTRGRAVGRAFEAYSIHVEAATPEPPEEPATPEVPAELQVPGGSLDGGAAGEPYSFQIKAGGDPAPKFKVTSGDLPPGLSLDEATGLISGVATTAGEYTFTVTASNDLADGPHEASATYVIVIAGGSTPPEEPVPSTDVPAHLLTPAGTLPGGEFDKDYSFPLSAEGDPAPGFSVTDGDLPPGLTLDLSSGVIAGTPSAAGTYRFTVTATNTTDAGPQKSELVYEITIVPGGVAPSITTPAGALPGAVAGSPYSVRIEATGDPAFDLVISDGTYPEGLGLDPVTGVLSGTPMDDTAGDYRFTVTARQTFAGVTRTAEVVLTLHVDAAPVVPPPPPPPPGPTPAVLTTPAGPLAPAAAGLPYSFAVGATGDPAPTFSVSDGKLPDGLTLDAATGVISGTATKPGTYTFEISATNEVDSKPVTAKFVYTITVDPEPAPAELNVGQVTAEVTAGVSYNWQVGAVGNPAPTFSVTGNLPPGLTLNPKTGVISGLPTQPGSYTFTITATNRVGGVDYSDSAEYTILIKEAPKPNNPTKPKDPVAPGTSKDNPAVTTGGSVAPAGNASTTAALAGLVLLLGVGAAVTARRYARGRP